MDDIYFDRLNDLPNNRAYTRIDFNRAIVGNQWLQRTYSGFFGTTNSLTANSRETEWVIAQNPEFMLTVDGNTITPMDLGEVDVSDECSELGATLLITKSNADIEVSKAITALHEVPAITRTLTITNRSPQDIQLENVAIEILAWEPEDLSFLNNQFRQEQSETCQCEENDACIAAMSGMYGMLYGILGQGQLHLHSPSKNQCQWIHNTSTTLASRESWSSPESYLIPCTSDPFDTYRVHHADMITQLKLAQRKASRIQQTLEEEKKALEESNAQENPITKTD